MATTMSTFQNQNTPSHANLVIQMSGAPGSGKSTMAKLLQQAIGGVVIIDHDILRSSLLEDVTCTFDLTAKRAYSLQWALVEDMSKQGLSVIIDSPCNFPEVLVQGQKIAKRHGCSYWYIECKVEDISLLDERLRTRSPMKSQRTGVDRPPPAAVDTRQDEDSRALFMKWSKHPCRPEHNTIIIDAISDPETQRDLILKQIQHFQDDARVRDGQSQPCT